MAIAFNLPMLGMVARSLAAPDLTLGAYAEIVESPIYFRVILSTIKIALIATIACALLGYPLAYWMRGLAPRAQMLVVALVVLPFWISVLIRTYAWIVMLGSAGIVNGTLLHLGLIDKPIQFLYNETGVTIGVVNVLLPFLVLPLFAAMLKIDDRLLQAAAVLGAEPWAVFRRVFFPLTLPALAAGSILVFVMTLGFYVTPAILGGGRVPMIVNMLDLLINRMPQWELASALSVLLLALTLASYWLSKRLSSGGGIAG